jgi:putative flippase GtrA
MVFSFASNRRVTFAGLPDRVPPAVQFARFAAINLGSLVLTTALVHLLTPSLDPVGAKLAAVPVGLAWNYGLSRRLLFA